MAGDFYKQFLFLGLSIFFASMDSGQTTLMIQDIRSSLQEINFTVATGVSTNISIRLVDTFNTSGLVRALNTSELVDEFNATSPTDNSTQYFFANITKLTPGSLFTLTVYNTNNESREENIATKPEAVKGLEVKNIRFTSARIEWNAYEPPQNQDVPEYRINGNGSEAIEDNFTDLSQLSPGTSYQFVVAVLLYNHSSENSNISFTTLPVFPPNVTSIVAVNTSALNVTWTRSQSSDIYPEYVNITSQNGSSLCDYKNESCVIEIGLKPGHNHTLNIFSVEQNHTSERQTFYHPTKPLPPGLSDSSTDSSLTITCSPQESDFDFYLIDFKNDKNESKKISKDGVQDVTATFPNLRPKTGYQIIAATISGTEYSANITKMFFTNPSLDQVNISVQGNSVSVSWTQPDYENCSMCLYSYCKNVSGKSVTFENVTAGMEYLLNVSCYSKWSDPRKVVIPPLPATHVNLSSTTDSIEIDWEFDFNKSAVNFWFISIDGKPVQIPGNITRYKIQNLTSGTNYNVSVWSFAANKNSSVETRSIKTYPECMTTLHEIFVTNSSISLNLSETENSFDLYEFTLQRQNGKTIKKLFSNYTTNVTFTDLEAGVEYNISVKTVSGKFNSTPCDSTITARTRPNPPIVECQPSDRSIYVNLRKGQGNIDGFEIRCSSCLNFEIITLNSTFNASSNITKLTPYEIYLITVRTFAGNKWSESNTCNSTTNQSAPSEVQELKAEEGEKNVILLSWKKPKDENGIIRWYIGECDGSEVGTNNKHHESFNTSKESYKLTVKPGYRYTITVKAFTVALGPAKYIEFTSKTYAPGFKTNRTKDRQPQKSQQIGERSFTVEFPTYPFSEVNGRILNYTVIVARSTNIDKTQESVLPNWYQFDQNPSINSYQVIGNCSDIYQRNNMCNTKTDAGRTKRSTETSVKFDIGVVDCSKENTSYCNGYLKPDTAYYVKVRAYTQDAFQDTPFSKVIRTEVSGLPGYAIAMAVIFPLVTLFLAGLAFYLVKKRRLPKTSKVEKDLGHYNYNMPRYKPTSHPVNLINFKDHVAQMSSDSDFRFAEEFEDLKDIGKNQDLNTARLMCNRNKNRFANILPYDHSRVKLSPVDDEEGSDYINANYLPGFNSRREYIVTQGPLCSTRDDFWRMVLEQNVHNIVMLTRCVEKLREKCDHYWPESGDPIFYGDVQVSKMNETITPDWTITEFKMNEGEKSWNLRHFHFTSWPDFGVPNSPQVLVNFVQTVRRSLIKKGPIVVHCSAGVGRSGTFIVVDHCMQHIQVNDSVDVLGMVHEMRLHRLLMVQTEQQYIYIHHCLLNVLEASENEDIYQNVTINPNRGHDNQAFLEDDEGIHVA